MATKFEVQVRCENAVGCTNKAIDLLNQLYGYNAETNEFPAGTPIEAIQAINEMQNSRSFTQSAATDLAQPLAPSSDERDSADLASDMIAEAKFAVDSLSPLSRGPKYSPVDWNAIWKAYDHAVALAPIGGRSQLLMYSHLSLACLLASQGSIEEARQEVAKANGYFRDVQQAAK